MKIMKYVLTILVMVGGLNVLAGELNDNINVTGTVAKKVYKNLQKYTEKQCDDNECSIELTGVSCFELFGIYSCDLGHIVDGKFVFQVLIGQKAKQLYNSLQKVQGAFCETEYTNLCINFIQDVSCVCSGGIFNRKYSCDIGI